MGHSLSHQRLIKGLLCVRPPAGTEDTAMSPQRAERLVPEGDAALATAWERGRAGAGALRAPQQQE